MLLKEYIVTCWTSKKWIVIFQSLVPEIVIFPAQGVTTMQLSNCDFFIDQDEDELGYCQQNKEFMNRWIVWYVCIQSCLYGGQSKRVMKDPKKASPL